MNPSACAAIFLLSASCAQKLPPTAEPIADVVVKLGTRSLTVKDVEARLAEQPDFVRVRYQSTERRREFVDTLVREQLLVAEAVRQGLQNDPDVRSTMEKVMVQKLLKMELKGGAPSDTQLQAWFEAHRDEFIRPERVRISHVLWTPAAKAQAGKELEKLRKLKADVHPAAFTELAQRESKDEPSRAAGGDLGPRTREELTSQWGPTVAEAAFALQTPGQLSAVVEGAKGLHLLRLVGRQPGQEQKFEDVRDRISTRLAGETRTQQLEALIERLRKKSNVEVDEKNLAKVTIRVPTAPLVP